MGVEELPTLAQTEAATSAARNTSARRVPVTMRRG
jgi:hypothetical protein